MEISQIKIKYMQELAVMIIYLEDYQIGEFRSDKQIHCLTKATLI